MQYSQHPRLANICQPIVEVHNNSRTLESLFKIVISERETIQHAYGFSQLVANASETCIWLVLVSLWPLFVIYYTRRVSTLQGD